MSWRDRALLGQTRKHFVAAHLRSGSLEAEIVQSDVNGRRVQFKHRVSICALPSWFQSCGTFFRAG